MSAVETEVTELPASPGARLRREREARGLSQQQAAEQLTLDISVIVALEANDFASLGAPVFAKGHLRRYAALLELPEDDILGGYERSKAQPEQPTLVPRSRVEMAPVRGPSRWPFVLGGTAAFLVAAGLVAYIGANGWRLPWGHASKAAGATTHAAAAQVAVTQGATPRTPPPAAASAPTSPAAIAADAAPAALPPAGQVSLQLHFTTDSWVEVYDGTGKAVLYDLGKNGTDRAVTAVAPLSVTIGNAPAVRVAVNGRAMTLPPLPAGQTVARFSVDPDGSIR
ncbi:MAG TPA: RodZ domain-containing protein [Steroidobacteraceae bacterium]